MFEVIEQWFSDPQASASLVIALFAGTWAIVQLRPYPKEKRRAVLASMVEEYGSSVDLRRTVAKDFPPLMVEAYKSLNTELTQRIASRELEKESAPSGQRHIIERELVKLRSLEKQLKSWAKTETGISFTAAHEVLDCEIKLRAVCWCVESIKMWEADDQLSIGGKEYGKELLASAESLVNKLNNFALEYFNGGYPPRSMLGQLHRSIAVPTKALEPLVWAGSISRRWGRRISALGIVAQHYNDVTAIQRTNGVIWTYGSGNGRGEVVIHPPAMEEIYGAQVPLRTNPSAPRFLPGARLRTRAVYWRVIGNLNLAPRHWPLSYGGSRLRRHARREEALSSVLKFIFAERETPGNRFSLQFEWSLVDVVAEMKERANRSHIPALRRLRRAIYLGEET